MRASRPDVRVALGIGDDGLTADADLDRAGDRIGLQLSHVRVGAGNTVGERRLQEARHSRRVFLVLHLDDQLRVVLLLQLGGHGEPEPRRAPSSGKNASLRCDLKKAPAARMPSDAASTSQRCSIARHCRVPLRASEPLISTRLVNASARTRALRVPAPIEDGVPAVSPVSTFASAAVHPTPNGAANGNPFTVVGSGLQDEIQRRRSAELPPEDRWSLFDIIPIIRTHGHGDFCEPRRATGGGGCAHSRRRGTFSCSPRRGADDSGPNNS